jgi:NAD(P)-dependent dehydrogenase (short-subunit alcohol dehydrogenase family)
MSGAVLLTGASTGIGRAAVLRLSHHGLRVFAGVRREEDGAPLREFCGPSVEPILLDVTDAGAIARAFDTISSSLGNDTFTGLVNNAGIAVAGPIEMLRDEDWRRQFDVNFFGAVNLTRTFIPLLRAHRGRLVNVSSIAGKLASPFSSAYSASKFALEAFSDAARIELAGDGISVSVIEPGAVKTPIWDRGSNDARERLSSQHPETFARYEASLQRMGKFVAQGKESGAEPDAVAKAIEHALVDPKPRERYLIGTDARVQLGIARLPEALRDRIVHSALHTKK